MQDYREQLDAIQALQPVDQGLKHSVYALDELLCMQMETALLLNPSPNYNWFYMLMIVIHEQYKRQGLLEGIEESLVKEILLHHCFRYKQKTILEPNPELNKAQTEEYVKLRKKFRQGIHAILHRPGSSAE
jgi:hypothetical protein